MMNVRGTRQASMEDAAEIARLVSLLRYEASSSTMTRRLQTVLASDRHMVAVSPAADDCLFGWIEIERRASLIAGLQGEITGLVVDPSARRTGVGKALVSHAETWARSQGVERITVRTDILREAAGAFYESLGYTERKKQSIRRKSLND